MCWFVALICCSFSASAVGISTWVITVNTTTPVTASQIGAVTAVPASPLVPLKSAAPAPWVSEHSERPAAQLSFNTGFTANEWFTQHCVGVGPASSTLDQRRHSVELFFSSDRQYHTICSYCTRILVRAEKKWLKTTLIPVFNVVCRILSLWWGFHCRWLQRCSSQGKAVNVEFFCKCRITFFSAAIFMISNV